MSSDRIKAVRELLAFYREAGVDALVGETPVNRFGDSDAEFPRDAAEGKSTASSRGASPTGSDFADPAQAPAGEVDRRRVSGGGRVRGESITPRQHPPPSLSPLLPPDAAAMAAREAAGGAGSLEELRSILDRFEGCALRNTASRLVFADGNPQAPVMLVGEAPGRDEDLQGLPFVGRSGQLLDRMLAAIGLDRRTAYIANIVPWRPPGNRTPTPQEAQICLPFIRRQIELVDPDILVCLGGPAAQALLGVKDGIMRTRGRWLSYHTGRREIRAIATFHPAFLLRSPLQKRLAWRDFLAIKQALES